MSKLLQQWCSSAPTVDKNATVIYIKSNYSKEPSASYNGKITKYPSIFVESHSRNVEVHKGQNISELNIGSRSATAESKLSLEAESLKN